VTDFMSVLASAAVVGAIPGSGAATQPVRLEVETQGSTSIVRVVVDSNAACTASYELAVSADGGGNRSVNRGTVNLPSRGAITVATVKVSRNPGSATTATLDVTPCGGKSYQQVWTSREPSAQG
jgi:hypothetical protein